MTELPPDASLDDLVRQAACGLGIESADAQTPDQLLTAIEARNEAVFDALQRLSECQRASEGFRQWHAAQTAQGGSTPDAEARLAKMNVELEEARVTLADCLTFASALQQLDLPDTSTVE